MSEPIPLKDQSGLRWADVSWLQAPGAEVASALLSWNAAGESLGEQDAAELGHMAAMKWRLTTEWGTVASSVDDLRAAIARRPAVEVTGMLVLSAEWFPGRLLGIALFHRTWQHKIYLDFLAAHPATQRQATRVAGIGVGLLFTLAEIGLAVGISKLWGETTENSGPYYQGLFGQAEPSDELQVSSAELAAFVAGYRRKLPPRVP